MTVLLYSFKDYGDDAPELQYSLRSLEANLRMPDLTLVLVGDQPPSWLEPDLFVVGNAAGGKVANMADNVWRGCQTLQYEMALPHGPADEVIYFSDDYFLMDPVPGILPTNAGPLFEHVRKCQRDLQKGHWYTQTMVSTEYRLEQAMNDARRLQGLYSYELHRPMPIRVWDAARELAEIPENVFWRTWYGNMVGYERRDLTVRDGRFIGKTWPLGVPWLSTEDSAWRDGMGKKIAAHFPNRSRWER